MTADVPDELLERKRLPAEHRRCACGAAADPEERRFPYGDPNDGFRTHWAAVWRCPACGERWINTPYGRVGLSRRG